MTLVFNGIVFPENQKFTIVRRDQNYDEGEPFYDEDSNLESPYGVILFTTGRNLALIEKRNNFYGDGTFNVSPKLMTQLYTIQKIIRQKCLPMVNAMVNLPNKKYLTYLTLFQLIFQKNISNYPKSISLAFEKAVFKAVTEVFPLIFIYGCFFHLSQTFFKTCLKI